MKRTALTFAALCGLLAMPATASADRFESTLGEPLREIAHRVDIAVEDGVATYTVQRTFANQGDRHDEAVLELELPPGAAATGLRIKARDRWYDGELLEAGRAAQMYLELTGMGPHAPRDPALLAWMWADQLSLQIFPVPPHSTATVEYTLTVPTRYRDGEWYVSYPRGGSQPNLAVPLVTFPAQTGGLKVDGRDHAAGTPYVAATASLPPLCDTGGGAGCVVAQLVVDRTASTQAVLRVDIDHTYRGDLKVDLVHPDGVRETIAAGSGSENDLHIEKVLTDPVKVGNYHVVVSDNAALDVGTLERVELAFDDTTVRADQVPQFIPDADSQARFATFSGPAHVKGVAKTRYGRLQVDGTSFARLEIDVAPELGSIPKDLAVVFVVDGSHSMGHDAVAAQLDVVSSYLSHTPDAKFEVVTYRRFAERAFGQWTEATDAASKLVELRAKGRFDTNNGSALDAGLELANRVLASHRGTKRVVVFTDDLLRPSFEVEAAQRLAAADTIHHVVMPSMGARAVSDARNDLHPLSAIARGTGGIMLEIFGLGGHSTKALAEVTLGLVRPVRLDNASILGGGLAPEVGDQIQEGAEVRYFEQVGIAPRVLRLQGDLWARHVSELIENDRTFEKAVAGWVFSHDLHHELTDEQMMALAMLGRAVTPVTSYLAIEPGTRPSRAGIPRGVGRMGSGGGGLGSRGYGRVSVVVQPPSLDQLVAPIRGQCATAHAPVAADLTVHLTFHEIVDVVLANPQHDGPYARCVVEGVWALQLPTSFRQTRDRRVVRI